MLSPLDKLYVVHVYKDGRKEKEKDSGRWCAGGPLLPAMRTALAKFPHQVVELEVRCHVGALLLPVSVCGMADPWNSSLSWL